METTYAGFQKIAFVLCLTGLLGLLAPELRAEEGDPPTRVARISYTDGTVSFQPNGSEDWGTATRNRPMTIGDRIWSDKDSRAELQAGQAAIHLGSMTALSFLNLDENTTQMRLAEGSIHFRVRELRGGELYEVDAPNLAFTVKRAGAFRVDVNENGDATRVTVFRGEGEVTAGGRTYEVHEGERAEFNGTDNLQYSVGEAPRPDGLDRWAAERDAREDNSASARYVSRDTVGYGDLDDYGDWREVPDYGYVWYPRAVGVGWAPYSYGYWNYVGPWGWTWVDYEPWGFAPFHYGRWAYAGGGWGWCPGPIFARPVYGPAFVGFFGGGHWGFGFGGGVGWFPLGFGEPFFPWFHSSVTFINIININNTRIRNINVLNSTNVRNFNFVNAHNVNAVTVASRSAFVNGERINRGAFRVNEASLRGAEVSNRAGFNPTRQSLVGAENLRGRISRPPASIQSRPVMARTAPAAGASRMPVRTFNQGALQAGRFDRSEGPNGSTRNVGRGDRPSEGRANHPAGGAFGSERTAGSAEMTARQHQLAHDRPPSARPGSEAGAGRNPGSHIMANPRTWEAQGNATDHGRAPQGFGRSSGLANEPTRNMRMNTGDRPPWAGGAGRSETGSRSQGAFNRGSAGPASGNRPSFSNDRGSFGGKRDAGRSFEAPQRGSADRPSFDNGSRNSGRSFQPPQRSDRGVPSYGNRDYGQPRSYSAPRSYSPPQRSYPAPSRGYSAPSRSYSGPSRSYSAPSRGYSAPSRSYGGDSSRGGGGSAQRGGGGSSTRARH